MKRDGEYLELIYDEFLPREYFIRGHISDNDAIEILNYYDVLTKIDHKYIDKNWVQILYKAIPSSIEHCYGRWSLEPGPDGTTHVLRDYKDRGRGRFLITKISIGEWAAI